MLFVVGCVQRPEKEIVVVTHGTFLHYLTEDWEDSHTYEGTYCVNKLTTFLERNE